MLLSADWGLLPTRWVAHKCSSAQTEGCYPWDEWLTSAPQHRLRVVICKMSGSHVLISADRGSPPTRWVAHKCSSAQTEGCYPQDEWLTHALHCRLRVVTHKISSSQMLVSTDWGLLPTRWVAHMCLSAQTEGCYCKSIVVFTTYWKFRWCCIHCLFIVNECQWLVYTHTFPFIPNMIFQNIYYVSTDSMHHSWRLVMISVSLHTQTGLHCLIIQVITQESDS